MELRDFNKIVIIGAGLAAEWIYRDIEKKENVKCIVDLLDERERKIKSFHEFKVCSLKDFVLSNTEYDGAFVMAIGVWNSKPIIRELLEKYNISENNLFVPNPYVSLRTFCRNDYFMSDERKEITDEMKSVLRGMFGDEISLAHYEKLMNAIPWDKPEDKYDIKYWPDIKDMYYLEEDYWNTYSFKSNVEIATVLDCGAYIGDSIIPLCNVIPESEVYYYAFEPVHENALKIPENANISKIKELKILEYGVGAKDEIMYFKQEDDLEGGRFVDSEADSNDRLQIRAIDNLGLDIQGRLYIKMDIEGAELDALKGAVETIKKEKPWLAICLYHRKNDLIDIPMFIQSLGIKYNYYLRGGYHTILWAIPEE